MSQPSPPFGFNSLPRDATAWRANFPAIPVCITWSLSDGNAGRSGRRLFPVLLQACNPGEFPEIMGDEREIVGQCGGRDEQVIRADGLACSRQRRPNRAVLLGAGIIEGQRHERGEAGGEEPEVLGGPGAAPRAEQQFGLRHRRDSDLRRRVSAKAAVVAGHHDPGLRAAIGHADTETGQRVVPMVDLLSG